jgi:excisionase family DNA binding protein
LHLCGGHFAGRASILKGSKMSATLTQAEPSAKLLDVQAVAEMLGCSQRHVYRLSDAGRMPSPVKLGSLVRWSAAAIREWIDQGCPSIRQVKGAGR